MFDTWFLVGIVGFCAFGFLLGWHSRHARGQTIDRLGRRYNVQRWAEESDERYLERIRNRIMINGGRKW